ncbi:MAG: carboxypeptidase-like regulatory domain-containing protein, partial [Bacteroidales bacterium]
MRTVISALFLLYTISLLAQKITVSGVVRGEEGERIAGAIVKVKGEEAIGATDDEGKYAIDVKPDGTLIFESIGYSSQTIDVKGKRTINVKLKGS